MKGYNIRFSITIVIKIVVTMLLNNFVGSSIIITRHPLCHLRMSFHWNARRSSKINIQKQLAHLTLFNHPLCHWDDLTDTFYIIHACSPVIDYNMLRKQNMTTIYFLNGVPISLLKHTSNDR